MNERTEDDERLLDWGLADRLGEEGPPDLVDGVREQLAAGTGVTAVRRPSWPLAALLLLGAGAVVAVALWGRPEASVPVPAQEPHPVEVSTVEEIVALPPGTRAVAATNLDDEAFAALARLRELEVLVVREPWNMSFGVGIKITAPLQARHVTAACWRTIPGFTKLRRLELSGVLTAGRLREAGVAGPDLGTRLAAMPLLESLTLSFLDLDDDALALLDQLAALRRLDLSFNHGFDDAGLDHVLRCRSLRTLSLRGCQQLSGAAMARLSQLPELEELDLSSIDGINWRSNGAWLDDTEREIVARAQQLANRTGIGVHDATLVGLAQSRSLRRLDIAGARHVTPAGLAALGDCASLRELGAFGVHAIDPSWVAALPQLEALSVCDDFTDAFCDAVRGHLQHLRRLDVAACYRITDRGLATLLAMPSLRALDMGQMYGLTAACLDTVAGATQLEELDVRNNDFVTARAVLRLRRALPQLRVLLTSVDEADIAVLEQLPPAVTVRSIAELEKLPGDTRNLVAADVDDEVMPALARLRRLERLELVADWTQPARFTPGEVPPLRSITDDGLRRLRDLGALRELVLHGQLGIEGPGLDVLDHLPALQLLELQQMQVSDAGLAHLARLLALRSLSLRHCQGFHDDTLRVIAAMGTLRSLSLCGCNHLEDTELSRLGALRDLGQLDLSMIGSHSRFTGEALHLPPAEPGSGITERVLAALAGPRRLTALNLGQADLSSRSLRHLHGLRLETLLLDGASLGVADLDRLPDSLQMLSLRGYRGDGAGLGGTLAKATPQLRRLDLLGAKIGRIALQSLRMLPSLRTLDLSYCPSFGADSSAISAAEAVTELERLPSLESLTIRGWMPLGADELRRLKAMPHLQQLDTDAGTQRLR